MTARPAPGDRTAGSECVFAAENLRFAYDGTARVAVDGVSLTIAEAEFRAVIGPNGSGKSTLARLLTGMLRPISGRALYRGRDAHAIDRRELARDAGFVPQSESHAFPLTARELVAMGRYPHLGVWRAAGAADRRAVEDAMERCDVADLSSRVTSSLSGGERQRVLVARALAQKPRVLVLDEPTASLDVRHEMAIFELLQELRADGVTVLLVTHNLNLAARYADELLLLDRGAVAASGPPHDVLRPEVIRSVYGWPVAIRALGVGGVDDDAPHVVPLRPEAP